VREKVKAAGGQWDPQRQVWKLRYDRVGKLGLKKRLVKKPSI